jgi:hypothetical protein
MSSAPSADDVKLATSFDLLREQILTENDPVRLAKPLAYWVLPNDRRLPLAFLARTLRQLLSNSYAELAATAGVGPRKMASLVLLLHRAATQSPAENQFIVPEAPPTSSEEPSEIADSTLFNPTVVSELIWSQWKETARLHGIGNENLGRLAPSLQSLPTVIWESPFGFYLDKSLEEIRELKTHGEKRVLAVLEVFHAVHRMLGSVGETGLAVRLAPRLIAEAEDWMAEAKTRETAPRQEEIVEKLCEPLLKQLEIDVGTTVCKLARARLGVGSAHQSVREQSREMGVTRARVYQLLEDCHRTMSVRWPEGKRLLDEFAQRMDQLYSSADSANLVGSLRELLYPLKFDALASHLLLAETGAERRDAS